MFSNETRLNHMKQLYLYLLKYKGFCVFSVDQIDDSYAIKLARKSKKYGKIPLHDNIILSPLPEEEDV